MLPHGHKTSSSFVSRPEVYFHFWSSGRGFITFLHPPLILAKIIFLTHLYSIYGNKQMTCAADDQRCLSPPSPAVSLDGYNCKNLVNSFSNHPHTNTLRYSTGETFDTASLSKPNPLYPSHRPQARTKKINTAAPRLPIHTNKQPITVKNRPWHSTYVYTPARFGVNYIKYPSFWPVPQSPPRSRLSEENRPTPLDNLLPCCRCRRIVRLLCLSEAVLLGPAGHQARDTEVRGGEGVLR